MRERMKAMLEVCAAERGVGVRGMISPDRLRDISHVATAPRGIGIGDTLARLDGREVPPKPHLFTPLTLAIASTLRAHRRRRRKVNDE